MTRSLRTLVGLALPILTIVIFAMLLAFSLLRLAETESDMRIEATQNMLWVISRTHMTSLQLRDAAATRALGQIDEAALQLRYELFLSRFNLINEGPQRRQMQALGATVALDVLERKLPELAALLEKLQPGGTQVLHEVDALLGPYDAMLTQAANRAMVADWDDLGSKLDTSRHQLWQIIISVLGISLAGAVMSAHFLLTLRDARRRTRLLDKEKAFSELLIGSSGEAIIALDLERRCTVWNEAAERLFSLQADNSIGKSLHTLSGLFQVDRINQAIDRALTGSETALPDLPYFPTGREAPLYVALRCFPLRDGQSIIGSMLLISDVTERHAAQRATAEHRDQLEHLVQARTRALDAALERERATADLYRNFGTMISHQFRTPLAIVDSALQRLVRRSERLDPAELRERGGTARQAIARLTRLVESTLDAARLDAGQIDIRSRPCDLDKLANEISAHQREAMPQRTIIVEQMEREPIMAFCDPVHVENILVNLLTNAVKYSANEAPVRVAVGRSGAGVQCSVTNDGWIHEQAERDALFGRYFRGRNAEGRPGIGIGLYMARALARMQGGDVQLVDAGSGQICFTLTLPEAHSQNSTGQPRARLAEPV